MRRRAPSIVTLAAAACLLAACSSSTTPSARGTGTGATGSHSTTPGRQGNQGTGTTGATGASGPTGALPPPPPGVVVGPDDVAQILARDTAVNNRANASLSLTLQDSHETCLQAIADDVSYSQLRSAGEHSAGGTFEQQPTTSFVPRQSSYPAYFTALTAFTSKGSPTTENLLTYVKTSANGHWRLDGSAEVLGPTAKGVALPSAARTAGGFAVSLPQSGRDDLTTSPDAVPTLVASAFDGEARSGKLPAGITAEFGPHDEQAPHSIVTSWAAAGTASVTYSTMPPPIAEAGAESASCPYPAYRLADGGALVIFPEFTRIVIVARTGTGLLQPSSREQFGFGLAPGTYQTVSSVWLDMMAAIVPPAGSSQPLEVVGQGSEELAVVGATTAPILT